MRDNFSKHSKKITGEKILGFIRSSMGIAEAAQLVRGLVFYSRATPLESKILSSIVCGSIYSRSYNMLEQMNDEEKAVERLVKLGLLYETRHANRVKFPSKM